MPTHADHESGARLRGRLLAVDAPEWQIVLGAVRHDFYHLPRYVSLCAAQQAGQPCALHVTDGERSMLLPLVIRSMDGGGGVDATSPYGYPGPLVNGTEDPRFLGLALDFGRRVLQDAGVVSAFVRLHPLLNPAPPEGLDTIVRHGETVSINLALSTGELWSQMRLNHRRDITRAARLGWSARMDADWQHLEAFKHLYRATMGRREASSFYLFDDAYFDDLLTALGDRLTLCLVERNGAVAAAGLFVETDGLVEYHLSGTDAEWLHLQPTKLMMHFVSGWAKERGDRILHLGGGVGSGSDSLLHFKAGFSPLRHPFSTLRMVIDESTYRRLVLAKDPSLDPGSRDGFFPLYRDR